MLRLVTICRSSTASNFYSGHLDVCTAIIIIMLIIDKQIIGPFIASKAKKVCQRQQFKLFDSNNFTLSLLCYLSKMHNPQQEKLCTCVLKYFSISIYSFSFWEVDSITTSFFSKSTFFNFSKPTSGKKAVRSKVNSTGYRLIRRMWCMGF